VKPQSSLLRRTEHVKTISQLDKEERASLVNDLRQWTETVKAAEPAGSATATLPPVRNQDPRLTHQQPVRGASAAPAASAAAEPKPQAKATKEPPAQRIAGHDFRGWDKFDVDKALDEMEEKEGASGAAKKPPAAAAVKEGSPKRRLPGVLPSETVANLPSSAAERERMAEEEKNKGNESVRSGDWAEAAIYYTRSLSIVETVAARNNRGLAYVKLGRFAEALSDCTAVLNAEPANAKALIRRASALQGLGRLEEALADANKVLAQSPDNQDAVKLQAKITKELAAKPVAAAPAAAAPAAAPATIEKKVRLTIEDDGDDDEDEQVTQQSQNGKESGGGDAKSAPPAVAAAAAAPPPAAPPRVLEMKETAKIMYQAGQLVD
jgi:tetratricopeptide (TPR) repeat protein